MYRTVGFAWASLLVVSLLVPDNGRAQTFQLLYAFQGGSDGSYPVARLMRDKDGNLYGTTSHGGGLSCDSGVGCGTVFELTSSGTEIVIHSFSKKGKYPEFGLIRDRKGNLYGTTALGGDGQGCGARGCGVVFKVKPDGNESILYSFQGGSDGGGPGSDLVTDAAGNFYGVTQIGGSTICTVGHSKVKGCGTIFELAPDGTETVLYRFQGGSDGQNPVGDLAMDAAGNLYGTTLYGGGGACNGKTGCGTVFKLAADGTETVLHAFEGPDGVAPLSGVILDSSGNLYGTTAEGGASCAGACGTVFRLAPDGVETILYSFCSQENCTDGANPDSGVVMDNAGDLFGTASQGGNAACSQGCGIVYELAPDGTETILHSFVGSDGANPYAGLIRDKAGNLYGTTEFGGANQLGTIFTMTP